MVYPTLSPVYNLALRSVGYDLAAFFGRYSPRLKAELESVLARLLTPE
jgi:hypothetical protein